MGDVLSFADFGDQLRIQGVNCKGFGILPKYVMLDPDLTIEAKTIYAYFCSFAGNGNSTFPGRDKILSDLPMSKDAYYKHFRQLTEQGYISVEQEIGDRAAFGKNIYNILPVYAGVYLYSRFNNKPFRQYFVIAMFGAGLAPIATNTIELNIFWIILGISIKIFYGFILVKVG